MAAVVPLNVLADNIVQMNDQFADVAMGEGIAPLLLAVGTLLIIFTLGTFGYLTLGAVVDLFVPE